MSSPEVNVSSKINYTEFSQKWGCNVTLSTSEKSKQENIFSNRVNNKIFNKFLISAFVTVKLGIKSVVIETH